MPLPLPNKQPTNHLDLASIEALSNALCGYGGGVMIATHDQSLMSSVLAPASDSDDEASGPLPGGGSIERDLWELKRGKLRRRDDGLEGYIDEVLANA